jgi:rubrerythrin
MQKTIENLAKAFAGESQARNRYTFYAATARNEGYEQIASIFDETANQEKAHAKMLMKHIQELKKNDLAYPAIETPTEVPNVWGCTADNLKAAIAGEHWETKTMYPEFAKTAREEGLAKIADRLTDISEAEAHHEERYAKLLDLLEKNIIFKRGEKVWWCCRECGYVHEGTEPPTICPVCEHPQAFYQLKNENY